MLHICNFGFGISVKFLYVFLRDFAIFSVDSPYTPLLYHEAKHKSLSVFVEFLCDCVLKQEMQTATKIN